MKTILTVLLLLGAGIFLFSYTYKAPPITDISVFRDITDKHLAQPKADEILSLLDFSGDRKWNGAAFRFSDLTDVSFNRVSEASIENANQWLSNEIERDKEIQKFKDDVSKTISTNEPIGKEHSSVYFPIASELTYLSQSRADRKILLVYSDLMENDLDISLYSKQELELLNTNLDSLKGIFEKRKALSSLQGIEVYFIYQPNNAVEDKDYRLVSDFYRSLLESKGAIVHISANLIN
jgi:hypothetical protein